MKRAAIPVCLLAVSAAILLLSIFFFGEIAHRLYAMTGSEAQGRSPLYSPSQLKPFYDGVVLGSAALSGLLFFFAARPWVADRLCLGLVASSFTGLATTPIYLISLYLVARLFV